MCEKYFPSQAENCSPPGGLRMRAFPASEISGKFLPILTLSQSETNLKKPNTRDHGLCAFQWVRQTKPQVPARYFIDRSAADLRKKPEVPEHVFLKWTVRQLLSARTSGLLLVSGIRRARLVQSLAQKTRAIIRGRPGGSGSRLFRVGSHDQPSSGFRISKKNAGRPQLLFPSQGTSPVTRGPITGPPRVRLGDGCASRSPQLFGPGVSWPFQQASLVKVGLPSLSAIRPIDSSLNYQESGNGICSARALIQGLHFGQTPPFKTIIGMKHRPQPQVTMLSLCVRNTACLAQVLHLLFWSWRRAPHIVHMYFIPILSAGAPLT